jgi:Raf kinase inhibitor-like YbhB/YbcL family protein
MKHLAPFYILALCVLLAGCGSPSTPIRPAVVSTPPASSEPTAEEKAAPSMTLSSTAFEQGASIPKKYTCSGDNSSPALSWTDPPPGTKSLALIVDDPDAPGGIWVHWVVYNLPPETRGLPEEASKAQASANSLPQGAIQGMTSFNRAGYGGPCPPSGQHRYFFRLYAADTTFDKLALDKAGLLKALEGHTLASTELMGVYKK